MYAINILPFGSTYLIQLRNEGTDEYVTVFPEMGACISQICLAGNYTLHPLLWAPRDEDELYKEGLPQYRGAILFPFVDRLENGKYKFQDVEYSFPRNEPDRKNAIHGFLNSQSFEVLHLNNSRDGVSVDLFFDYDGNLEAYPFLCSVSVRYSLNANGFGCRTKVQNKSGSAMPVGLGWHPYFRITEDPLQFEVLVPAKASYIIGEDLINTGKKELFEKSTEFLKMDNFSFNSYALIDEGELAKTVLRDKKKKIDVIIESEGYPFLQVYVVPNKAIAIEPLTCIGNAFNNGIGLTVLKPNEIMISSFGVKLSVYDDVEDMKTTKL